MRLELYTGAGPEEIELAVRDLASADRLLRQISVFPASIQGNRQRLNAAVHHVHHALSRTELPEANMRMRRVAQVLATEPWPGPARVLWQVWVAWSLLAVVEAIDEQLCDGLDGVARLPRRLPRAAAEAGVVGGLVSMLGAVLLILGGRTVPGLLLAAAGSLWLGWLRGHTRP